MTRKNLAEAVSTTDDRDMPDPTRRIILPKSLLKKLPPPAPVDVPIEELTQPDTERRPTTPHSSFSQLSMYFRCPKQYAYRYRDGLKDKPKVSLSIGKGGHAALEWNTKTKIRTGADAPVEALLDKASDMMDMYLSEMPPSEIEADVEPGSTKDKFLSATRIYRKRDAEGVTPLGAEVEFNLDLNEYLAEPLETPLRIVNGKIDLLYDDTTTHVVRDSGPIVRVGVEDYKYVTRKKSQAEVNLTPQLTLYNTVVQRLTGKWPTKVGLREMHPGTKTTAPDSIVLLREDHMMTSQAQERRMARLVDQFVHFEKGVRAEVFPATDNPINCSWCGYRERCQNSLVDDFEAARLRSVTTPPA